MFFFPSATSFRNDIAQPSLSCPQISQIHADFQKTPHSGVATGSTVVRQPLTRISDRNNLRMILFVAERFDRIQRGRFARRIITEENADGSSE